MSAKNEAEGDKKNLLPVLSAVIKAKDGLLPDSICILTSVNGAPPVFCGDSKSQIRFSQKAAISEDCFKYGENLSYRYYPGDEILFGVAGKKKVFVVFKGKNGITKKTLLPSEEQ